MYKLLVICGPTAAGKTEYALRLAEQWGIPILNADSRQIYRDLPIGTAAPTPDELKRAKHYFVGTHALNESYNAGAFERDAMTIIRQLIEERDQKSENPIAILSGGSMLYIEAVCKGLDDIPEVPASIRREVQRLYTEQGLAALQQAVQEADPEYWAIVDQRNPQRLMHCLELCRTTGGTYSALRKRSAISSQQSAVSSQQSAVSSQQSAIRPFVIERQVITRPREELYARINARVHNMVKQGLIDEADRAFRLTIGDDYRSLSYADAFARLPNSLRTVGYQELLPYLLGQISMEEAITQIQTNTRHYAKRQLTWWRNR
ncbi:MAG: tRNA (adenosine(37)-N6)-dimethylallyltransferase MiaA [Paludibacteraceae bacterium]|nr:tRNA (adenosine(37)-N6)-dimethylallyltransferase MiaA [Paludibacteraceae bacterium]